MTPASPALVAQAGARPLPRLALLLICLAYILPGQLSREPWRQGDLASFGFMSALARAESSWWAPTLAGLPTPDGALFPYWLGAGGILAFPMLEAELAARLPFVALLAVVLSLVWYASFHFARTEAAQPVAFAFGGEANTLDYARALADAALLALMASLGLLRIGHEASAALVQLAGAALWLYALAAAPFRPKRAQWLSGLGLLVLSMSGAPFVALLLASAGLVICQYSSFDGARRLRWGLALGMFAAGAAALLTHAWTWRLGAIQASNLTQLLLWFLWPSGALALWTLWRWRHHLGYRHIAVPMCLAGVGLLACLSMGGSDRALLVALPGLAVLASFALPTLKRSASAMLDWFSLFFFSAAALFIWAYYIALHTSWFPKLLANVQRQSPGFQPEFGGLELTLAVGGSAAWLALVRWRSSRQRAAIWRSLVLPAGGLVLVWLLAMTLWRPAADRALGHRSLLTLLQSAIPSGAACIAAPQQSLDIVATLEAQGGWRVDALHALSHTRCDWAVLRLPRQLEFKAPDGWTPVRLLERPADRGTLYWVLRRH